MRSNIFFILMAILLTAMILTGCALFRYTIIPQENKGPHGGPLVYIDERIPDYIEFVVIPGSPEWTFQVYIYDKNMKQRSICGSGYLTIVLSDGTKKDIDLWNTKPYFWNRGAGYLENKIKLNDVKRFSAFVSIHRRRSGDYLEFKYPY